MALTDLLKAWLSRSPGAPAPPPLPEPDANLALGTLLVRVAKADGAYLFEELDQIDRILALRNDIGPVAAAQMRATCERLDSAFPELPHFTQLIRDAVPYGERVSMVEALWRVARADGIEDHPESDLVHLIETQLGVSPEDSAAAHAAAETKTPGAKGV